MRNFCCGLILLLATGVLFSCGSKKKHQRFLDIPAYFEGEVKYIQSNYKSIAKTSIYNGISQTKEIKVEEINWEKEFGIFMECDINKPIYYANFEEIPTPALDTNSHMVHYRSKSTKTNIEEVKIGYREDNAADEVHFVMVRIKKSNLINATGITATYAKGYFYQIEGDQHIKYLNENNSFKVEGVFLK